MNKIFLIAAVIFSALSFASCSDDAPAQLMWEFSNYDNKEITAVYAPDYVNQVQVVAKPDYSGDITLQCTNYTSLSFRGNNTDGSFMFLHIIVIKGDPFLTRIFGQELAHHAF